MSSPSPAPALPSTISIPLPFQTATQIRRTKWAHIYTANFPPDWCIGSVPHGGYITSCFLRLASLHFTTTLSVQNQPDTITLHLSFLRRTAVGPAKFTVKDVKVGRATSTIHVELSQKDEAGRERAEVVGYITNANLEREEGPSFPVEWSLQPAPPPVELVRLREKRDEAWAEMAKMPFEGFRKASKKVRFFFPRRGQRVKGVVDEWVCFRDGSRFDDASVGFVADMFPQIVEGLEAEDIYTPKTEMPGTRDEVRNRELRSARYWYPTLLLNLDVKKRLPKEGTEFLFCRARAKRVRNGRYDLEVVIMDEGGDVIALSHHVVMILDATRNLTRKKQVGGEKL